MNIHVDPKGFVPQEMHEVLSLMPGRGWMCCLEFRKPVVASTWEVQSNGGVGVNMPKLSLQSENAIAETLLIPLHARAVEAQQASPLVRDEKAVALVDRIDYDFGRTQMHGHDHVFLMMRVREFDRLATDFLARHPRATIVHAGCGLDTRFERVDNDLVTWYDLDLPEVITLRRQLLAESQRCRFLGYSVLDKSWFDAVTVQVGSPVLILAEAVFPYLEEVQVKALFLSLMTRFPGAELVCDGFRPLMIRLDNLTLAAMKMAARLRWGLSDGRDPESWAPGIRLLDEWFYFERPEPRLGAANLIRFLPPFAKGVGIFHYQLGSKEGAHSYA